MSTDYRRSGFVLSVAYEQLASRKSGRVRVHAKSLVLDKTSIGSDLLISKTEKDDQ
jgi:hypothetical protein